MSLWSRIANALRGDRLSREIDEEMQSHIEEAIRHGRDPNEARRAFGAAFRHEDASRDLKVVAWIDSLRADAIFGWRRLTKRKVTSAAAVFSLALAIGACTSAYRLIDAVLLRPLPVAAPEQLYAVARQGVGFDGKLLSYNAWAYPDFLEMRAAVKDRADLVALSFTEQTDLTFGSDQDFEKAYLQYVSGWTFSTFGLKPAAGRLFTADEDREPNKYPYAVLSYDYWKRRFGGDPKVIGRTFHLGAAQAGGVTIGGGLYEIIGVAEGPFSGTEPGIMTDVFLPTAMYPAFTRDDWTWFRTLARVKPGLVMEPIRAKLDATSRAWETERAKGFTGMSKENIAKFIDQSAVLEPAAAGASGLQSDYRLTLTALGVLVALVLLIACANVANLMTAQAAARAREMALRVSIGAGRARLVQLVLMESAWLAFLAGALGALFAWWSAPFVVSKINPPDHPARIALPADCRVLAFGLALTVAVTLLLGLLPALRASAVKPASALKGGDDPHSRRRLMHALIVLQVAFCFLVLFVAGLFAATFERLSSKPTGFSAERVLTLGIVAAHTTPPAVWQQVADRLGGLPGVERVAICGMPLLGGGSWNGFVSVNGAPPSPVLAMFLNVSPGWTNAMGIPFIKGRDLLPNETSPGAAIVNETFAREFFGDVDPVGKSFARGKSQYQVVALVRDAPYRNLREPPPPVAYVPFQEIDNLGAVRPKSGATFIVRSSGPNPLALASLLRQEIPRARSEFRVTDIRSQSDLVRAQTVRERLLALLAAFFAGVALLLAGVGLYGVLDYSVLQRRREIGIRMAIGARPAGIARLVTREIAAMVLVGALAGVALGMSSVRYIETLLYQVKPTAFAMLSLPSLAILAAAFAAALPAVIHAVRIDPVEMLRSE
jgi:putative ABC transport system permease protein